MQFGYETQPVRCKTKFSKYYLHENVKRPYAVEGLVMVQTIKDNQWE